jgi:diaminohydroxyphosphoribosylaminopyrimidine deaminase/5-amino-6-(5-phosphoribosylamino)uracil reductase
VVLDSAGRTPADARLIGAGTPGRALIAVTERAPAERVSELEAGGATVVRCASRDGRVDVGALLANLAAREVRAVLVEGGGEVLASFLAAGVVDRVAVFLAPLLLGGRAAPSVLAGHGRELKSAVRLAALTVTALGDDLLLEADVVRDAAGG